MLASGPYRPVPGLPFARAVEEGCMFPAGYGLAWRDWNSNCGITFPIPLNFVAHWLHDWYLDLTVPKALRDDVWSEGEHHAAFRRGVEAGRAFALKGL